MATWIAQLTRRLQQALAQYHALQGSQEPGEDLVAEAKQLLQEIFLKLPLKVLDQTLGQGLELAALLRASLDQENDAAIDAQIGLVRINNSRALDKDPRARLGALAAPAEAFLMQGMMEEFAACIEAIGDAQRQLGHTMKAGTSYRKALMIYQGLGLSQHLPRLFLSVGQVFRANSVRGRISWNRTRYFFDACAKSLADAPIDEIDRERIASACLIGGASCSVEDLFQNMQRHEVSEKQLCESIHKARQDIKKGMHLASRHPALAEYVRIGEISLLRLEKIEDAILGSMPAC